MSSSLILTENAKSLRRAIEVTGQGPDIFAQVPAIFRACSLLHKMDILQHQKVLSLAKTSNKYPSSYTNSTYIYIISITYCKNIYIYMLYI